MSDLPKWLDQGVGFGLLALLVWRLDSRMEQVRLTLERLSERLTKHAGQTADPRSNGAD
jgi:hypothetical protein